MSSHSAYRAALYFLLCTAACAGKAKGGHGEIIQQAPPQEPAAPVAKPGAREPSTMLMDLEPPPAATAKAQAKGPQSLPEETPPPVKPGAKLPATMLKDLEPPPAAAKAAEEGKPMPLPEEPKPPR